MILKNQCQLSNKETDNDEFQLIIPNYFDLKDLIRAKAMLGELLYDLFPLPFENIPSFNHCPIYIRKSYVASFFPSKEDFHGSNVIRKQILDKEKEKKERAVKRKKNN